MNALGLSGLSKNKFGTWPFRDQYTRSMHRKAGKGNTTPRIDNDAVLLPILCNRCVRLMDSARQNAS